MAPPDRDTRGDEPVTGPEGHAEVYIRQEPDRVPGGTVVRLTVATIAITVALVGVAWGIANRGTDRRDAGRATPQLAVPDEVNRIEMTLFPIAPGLEMRARQQQHLRRYGWVDRSRGVVHIPIDRAIRLYLDRRASGAASPAPPGPPPRGPDDPRRPPPRRTEEINR